LESVLGETPRGFESRVLCASDQRELLVSRFSDLVLAVHWSQFWSQLGAVLSSVEERRAVRLRVMNTIYEASGASEAAIVSGPQLLEDLGLTDDDLADACKYLEGERLIKCHYTGWGHRTPYHMQITHSGIKEMEQSHQAPGKPTQHFPPLSVVYVQGNMVGSVVQSGSPGAHQEVTFGDLDLGAVNKFLGEYDARASELNLPSPQAEELAADIATVRTQVESPRPKKNIVIESLRSARTILELTAGSAAAVGLLDALKLIHL
jgi:hypothetical protein